MDGNGQAKGLATIIGSNLRALREDLDLTQNELARRVGGKVDGQRISDWERGVYRPNDHSLQRLAEVLDRPFPWFFTDRADDEKAAA